MNRFMRLYKQKLRFIRYWILERTLYPQLRVIRGVIGAILVMLLILDNIPLIQDLIVKLTVKDGKLENVEPA